jgi:hypothetical protein
MSVRLRNATQACRSRCAERLLVTDGKLNERSLLSGPLIGNAGENLLDDTVTPWPVESEGLRS